MEIERIETYPLLYRLQQPYGDANGYKQYRTCFLIRIVTRSGIDGWGECIDWLPALELGFRERLIPFLRGKNAIHRITLASIVKKWHQRAAAAISMALTEIVAKWANLSVCDLWGGRQHQYIPVYASFQSYTDCTDWQERSLQAVEQAASRGFAMVKVKIGGKSLVEDKAHIEKLISLLDSKVKIALDANQSYDLAAARSWSMHAGAETITWLEEPLPLSHPAEYKRLREASAIPLAGGENLAAPEKFVPFVMCGGLDILQPDPLHLDGIEAYRQSLALARQFGLRCSPHTFDGGLSRLYALMAQAVLPNWSKMEGEELEPVEWDAMENPFTRLFPLEVRQSQVTLPDGIGIGCEPDWELVKTYRW
ncbi:MAG: mandelate racemase/muconate lactonizing enzyme family protein, partial [Clostridia bacterium]